MEEATLAASAKIVFDWLKQVQPVLEEHNGLLAEGLVDVREELRGWLRMIVEHEGFDLPKKNQ